METLEIGIYNQNCNSAGSRCWKTERDDGTPNPDCTVYRGTREELAAEAAEIRRLVASGAYGAGTDIFALRCAATIEAAL
jgi:hypothetical protein